MEPLANDAGIIAGLFGLVIATVWLEITETDEST